MLERLAAKLLHVKVVMQKSVAELQGAEQLYEFNSQVTVD